MIAALFATKSVFAGDGGNTGGSNWGCGAGSFCTTYGASWKYYKLDKNDPASDSVVIPYEKTFAVGTTITGCRKYGGYWRYAMVSRTDGRQHGVIAINRNSDNTFNSTYFGGGMHYRAPGETYGSDASWSTVQAEYNKWASKYPEDFTIGWGGALSWFCGGDPEEDEPEDPPVPVIPSGCTAWAPSSYNSSNTHVGTTSVVIGVRNQSVSNNNSTWHHMTNTGSPLQIGVIYAKPQDNIQWQYCYYPGAQMPVDSDITVGNIHPENQYPAWHTNTLNNSTFRQTYPWQNQFSVTSSNLRPGFGDSRSYTIGDSAAKGEFTNNYGVQPTSPSGNRSAKNPGETLSETITSGSPSYARADSGQYHSWNCGNHYIDDAYHCGTHGCNYVYDWVQGEDGKWNYEEISHEDCPNSCWEASCHHTNNFYYNEHYGTASDHADVLVPYNYTNTASVQLKRDRDYVYVGEEVTVESGVVKVETRYNNETQGNYSTNVPGGQMRLISYLSATPYGNEQAGVDQGDSSGNNLCSQLPVKNGRCDLLDQENRELNADSQLGGYEEKPTMAQNHQYNVYDEAAGNYFCVVLAVWPYTVNGDRDMSTTGGSSWFISAPSCIRMAKKPNFQVWGAGVYSADNIVTSITDKNNIKGYENWSPTQGRHTLFGSWGELAVTAEGAVSGFASGASTGYRGGLPTNGSFYGTGYPGGLQGDLSRFCVRSPLTIGNFYCNSAPGYFTQIDTVRESIQSDKAALLTRFGDEVQHNSAIGETWLARGETRVNVYDGNIQINGNINFPTGTYKGLNDIPKYIIYARGGSININCNVTRIDAVLIADGNVNTCNNGDTNSRDRSHQLVIRGAVVTGSLTLNRSFGANVGGNSMVPAELINYDSSLYLWAHRMAEGGNSGLLTETGSRELPPRY